jgi:hypothetical protein
MFENVLAFGQSLNILSLLRNTTLMMDDFFPPCSMVSGLAQPNNEAVIRWSWQGRGYG